MNTLKVINVASVPHRSPFRYPGGKTWLVPHVRAWLGQFRGGLRVFSEPFAGGGIVGLSMLFDGLCNSLELVELDPNVASVWKTILQGDYKGLASAITAFEVTEENVRIALSAECRSEADRAFATIVRNRMQRGGIMAPGASLMKSGENGRGLKSRWYPETLSKRILAIGERREHIRFIEGDALEYLSQRVDCEDIAFFVDPPYTVAGKRLYLHSQIDHVELFRLLSTVKGNFLMTYDDTPEIRNLADKHGFDTVEVVMKNTHHEIMVELLIGTNLGIFRSSTPPQALQNSLFEGF